MALPLRLGLVSILSISCGGESQGNPQATTNDGHGDTQQETAGTENLAGGGQPNAGSSGGGAGTAGVEQQPMPELATSYVLDDMDHTNLDLPAPPPGSGFVYRTPSGIFFGNWFVTTINDSTTDARIELLEPPRGDSTKAVYAASESGMLNLWAQLDHPMMRGVDLSPFQELTFWARSSQEQELLVALDVHRRIAEFANGELNPPRATLRVSSEWTQFAVRMEELFSSDTHVGSIDFLVLGNGEPTELWIDDLALLCPDGC